MPRLVLASTSPYRAELLGRLEVEFDVAAHRYDERAADALFETMAPEDFAARLARGKAESLTQSEPDAWILAADQIAVVDGALLTKPGTVEAAVDQLMRLSGRTHQLITGVCLLEASTGRSFEALDRQELTMRQFERDEAHAYVARHLPLDCAGSYRIEDAGIKLFERVVGGDYTGIIGLPLLAVADLLRRAHLLV